MVFVFTDYRADIQEDLAKLVDDIRRTKESCKQIKMTNYWAWWTYDRLTEVNNLLAPLVNRNIGQQKFMSRLTEANQKLTGTMNYLNNNCPTLSLNQKIRGYANRCSKLLPEGTVVQIELFSVDLY